MKLLKKADIDIEKWNACITSSDNPLVYGLIAYLDIVAKDWQGLVWEDNEQYVAVFPLPIRVKYGLEYIYPPFFIQQLGLFTRGNNRDELEKEAFDFLNGKINFRKYSNGTTEIWVKSQVDDDSSAEDADKNPPPKNCLYPTAVNKGISSNKIHFKLLDIHFPGLSLEMKYKWNRNNAAGSVTIISLVNPPNKRKKVKASPFTPLATAPEA